MLSAVRPQVQIAVISQNWVRSDVKKTMGSIPRVTKAQEDHIQGGLIFRTRCKQFNIMQSEKNSIR